MYIMKNILWILILFFIVGLSNSVFAADFPDVQWHIYEKSITYLQDNDIIKWYPDGTFWPERGVTRAEMLKIILKPLLEEKNQEDEIDLEDCWFIDVAADDRFTPYVCYAKENEIVRWYPDNTFKPDQAVTIAEWLKIALETFDQPVDETQDPRWFEPYVDYVHQNNLFSKYALRPEMPMTRAQLSFLTHQLLLEKDNEIDFEGKRSNLSLWCEESSKPSRAPTSTIVRDQTRNFITSVGSNVDHDDPTKLVIAVHGRTSPNTQVRQYYGLEKAWDKDAIIIYPSGLPEWWPSRSRRAWWDASDELRWFELFDQIVEDIWSEYCVDLDEIYVVGHSLGAWFTHSLACARGDMIRATWSVGWSTTRNACSWPVASLIMHNPNDRLASFAWWVVARDQLLEQNACGSETKDVGPRDWNCVEYTNCTDGAPVVRCPHTQDRARWDGSYYPHTWPDFAGEMIWDFFEEHSG